MQLTLWIIAISVVAGPILLGLLLHRLGFSRAVTLGFGMAIVGGGTILLSREPFVDSSTRQRAVETTAAPAPPSSKVEVAPVKSQGNTEAALSREKAAHEETRRALAAAQSKIAETAARSATPDEGPGRETALPTGQDDLAALKLRLAIANAEIERLKATIRAADPVATATPLPATPQPFAYAPVSAGDTRHPALDGRKSDDIATGTTSARPDDAGETAPGRILAEAMRSRSFTIVKLNEDEVVEGRRASYYRLTCPGADDKPLTFGAGDYTFDEGFGALDKCVNAIEAVLLKPLPSDIERRVYVQGYASFRGFIRPKTLSARDTHLKSFTYLKRITGTDRYASKPARQTTERRFVNADLPNLRAASVAHRIGVLTRRTIEPQILEGELRPGSDTISQSFALVVQMAW